MIAVMPKPLPVLETPVDATRLRRRSLMLADPGLGACTRDLTEPPGLTRPSAA